MDSGRREAEARHIEVADTVAVLLQAWILQFVRGAETNYVNTCSAFHE